MITQKESHYCVILFFNVLTYLYNVYPMLYMKQKNRQKNTFEEKPLLQLKQNLSPFFQFLSSVFRSSLWISNYRRRFSETLARFEVATLSKWEIQYAIWVIRGDKRNIQRCEVLNFGVSTNKVLNGQNIKSFWGHALRQKKRLEITLSLFKIVFASGVKAQHMT